MRLWGLGRWAGESSRCEDPAPTVGIAGRRIRGMPPTGMYAAQASTGTANGRITTRRAALLRPSRNGRIDFRPPYSKKSPWQKACMCSIFLGDFPFLRVNRFQSRNSNFSKTVATRRAASFYVGATNNHISID